MWFIVLMGLVTPGLFTEISVPSTSSSFSSANDQNQWTWREPKNLPDEQNSFHPLSFAPNTAKVDQYNPNIQTDSDSVTQTQAISQLPIDSVIDNILQSNRQGRNLEGYDELYADPEMRNIFESGNDTAARSFIKDKLCSLGLMNCENLEGRRPYYSPHHDHIRPQDIIYAQPVTIQPVGRPLPALTVKRPFGYGPPKPPGFSPDSLGGYYGPPHSFNKPYSGFKKPGLIHSTKPIYEEPGFEDQHDFISVDKTGYHEKKQIPISSSVQQHVHHHYHHANGLNKPLSIGVPEPIISPSGISGISGNTLNGYGYGSGGTYGNSYGDFEEYKKTFNIKSPPAQNNLDSFGNSNNGYANRFSSYEKPKADNYFGEIGSEKVLNSGIVGNKFQSDNSGLGNFGSNNFNNRFPSSSFDDCVCVPYDQCATINQAGRKDDLFLPIDPRNIEKYIDAESDETYVIDGNGTMTVNRITKSINATQQLQYQEKVNNVTNGQVGSENKVKTLEDSKRNKRATEAGIREDKKIDNIESRQGRPPVCGPRHVCCHKKKIFSGGLNRPKYNQCGVRNGQGVNGRIKVPSYIDGDSEFGEYPWQVAILKKDPTESVYVCGGTLISSRHILTAAHCVKTHAGHELRARLGEWDVNHDVEFYPFIERDIVSITVHPEFYAGTLYNDIAILKLDHEIDFEKNPHITPACLPLKYDNYVGARCWTTGWGKDAFGDFGKYQNILKEVDVPVVSNEVCQQRMRSTRLGPSFNLHPGFLCAGGEEGKDACKGDGGGPMICERNGVWHAIGVVSWGIGCGQPGVPGVYSKVSYYLDWIHNIIRQY